jgi:serine/threonine protein kinase
MTPERWQEIKKVLEVALSLEAAQRGPYLDETCSSDPELRQEVESLLAAYQPTGQNMLDEPVADILAAGTESPGHTVGTGQRIGAYRIIEEIGRGGMGEVYRAVRADGEFTKEVALKTVRGGYDVSSVLERFRNERQILASLDHLNIARLCRCAPRFSTRISGLWFTETSSREIFLLRKRVCRSCSISASRKFWTRLRQ